MKKGPLLRAFEAYQRADRDWTYFSDQLNGLSGGLDDRFRILIHRMLADRADSAEAALRKGLREADAQSEATQ